MPRKTQKEPKHADESDLVLEKERISKCAARQMGSDCVFEKYQRRPVYSEKVPLV
jgi:hypothetical protein